MKDVFLVYTGEIEGHHKFREIESLEENNGITWQGFNRRAFKTKLFKKGMSPGAIFPASKDGDSYSFRSSSLPIAIWKNQDDLVIARAQAAANRKQKSILTELGVNHFKESLSPLRDLYRDCSPSQKTMLLAEIMREITR